GEINLQGTRARLIGDVYAPRSAVSVKSGAVFGNTNAMDVDSFTVEAGGRFDFGLGTRTAGSALTHDGIAVGHGFSNQGTVFVGAAVHPTITGSYTQAATGTLGVGVVDSTSNYGRLMVSGTATLAPGATVDVRVASGSNLSDGATIQGVVTAGTLAAAASGLRVTDSSALYNFVASTYRDANQLDLIVQADSSGITSAVPQGPAAGAAGALQSMLNTGVPSGMQPVFAQLGSLDSAQLASALVQTLPAVQGAGQQAGLNALHSVNKVVQARVESAKGLSSGDGAASDRYLWARAFGNRGDQNATAGAAGFKSSTNGVVFGADAPVSDRLRAGGAMMVAKSNVTAESTVAPGHVDVDSYEAIGYASYQLDANTDLNYQLDIGKNRATSQRYIGFAGATASGRFDSLTVHGSVGVGKSVSLSEATTLSPSLRLDYTNMRTDGYTESGAGAL
ncbi:MAG: autotransporter domain-containing protein, partial [Alphaproteobacteria bacterium]